MLDDKRINILETRNQQTDDTSLLQKTLCEKRLSMWNVSKILTIYQTSVLNYFYILNPNIPQTKFSTTIRTPSELI